MMRVLGEAQRWGAGSQMWRAGGGGTERGPAPFCCGARRKAGGAVLAEGLPFPPVTFRSPGRGRERGGNLRLGGATEV